MKKEKLILIYGINRIIVSIMVQLSKAPSSVFWSVFLYTGAATGFFLVNVFQNISLPLLQFIMPFRKMSSN